MSHHTILHRAIRPWVRRVAGTRLHPNHLSLLRLGTAAAASAGFATGSRGGLRLGCALFTCSALLDRGDGELARQTSRFTKLGHHFDLVGDCTADALAFVALGYGARKGSLGTLAPVLGLAAGASVVALFLQLNAGPTRPPRVRAVDPDDAVFAVPALLLCLGAAPVVALAGTITPAVAILARWRRWRL